MKCNNITNCGFIQCNATCAEYLNQTDCKDRYGCRCNQPGTYYIPETNQCVTGDNCAGCSNIKCDPGRQCKLFVKCEHSCIKVRDPLNGCPRQKPIYACDCPDGQVFATASLSETQCIKKEECGCGICPRGYICQPDNCNATCTGALNPTNCQQGDTKSKCLCPAGQFLDDSGACVPIEQCQAQTCEKCKKYGMDCGQIDMCDGTTVFDCICPDDSTTSPPISCVNKPQCE